MANYMNEIVKLFGVELGESFKITSDTQGDYQNYYRFTENNFLETSYSGVKWEGTTAAVLLKYILMGDIRIVKLPWRPQKGDKYYIPYIATLPQNMYNEDCWGNHDIDMKRYRMGLVCKTKEEAVALTKKMLAVAKEGKNNG